jgi:hypothetical protein
MHVLIILILIIKFRFNFYYLNVYFKLREWFKILQSLLFITQIIEDVNELSIAISFLKGGLF